MPMLALTMSTQSPHRDYEFDHFVSGSGGEVTDCGTKLCPAEAAGYDAASTYDDAGPIAHEYDAVVRRFAKERKFDVESMFHGSTVFLLDESAAKEAWFQAIRNVKEGVFEWGQSHKHDFDGQAELGEEIARELGWLGADETVGPDEGET